MPDHLPRPDKSAGPSPDPNVVPLRAALVGQTEDHLCSVVQGETLGARVHALVVDPLIRLRADASLAGFDLTVFSGFRGFQRQLSIWNRKARGELPVLDSQAVPLDISRLTEKELVFSILRWSALPGGSRHHWGTDLDLIDAEAVPEGYEVQLIPEEVNSGGMFGPMHDWLEERIQSSGAYGFFRPYDLDRQGVAPERWHLSHAPVAGAFERQLSVDALRETIGGTDMDLKHVVIQHLDEIFQRFVINTGRPPR